MTIDVLSVPSFSRFRPQPVPGPRRNRFTIGFVTPHDSTDRRAFSGTAFFAARALEARPGVSLVRLGAPGRQGLLDRLRGRTPRLARLTRADLDGLDAVVGLVATGLLVEMAMLRPDLPFLHVTDATPAFLREAYGWAVPDTADAMEARVAEAAVATVYSSDALAARAPTDLGRPGMIPVTQPFGVNLATQPVGRPVKDFSGTLELMFVCTDWQRKGGDTAVAALQALLARGRDVRLTIVGACPDRYRRHPAIRATGFLDKNNRSDAQQLSALYRDAHLLLVPSRAECTPMVVGEAMAWGTPVIGADVGGISGQIGAGAGRVLAPFASPSRWAEEIDAMVTSRSLYEMMADAAFDRAHGALCWSTWAERIETLLHEVLAPRSVLATPRVAVGA